MAMYITKDNFVWLDVTDRMKYGKKKREEVWLAHELFVVHDDDSESIIESHDEIDEALKLGTTNWNRSRSLTQATDSKLAGGRQANYRWTLVGKIWQPKNLVNQIKYTIF